MQKTALVFVVEDPSEVLAIDDRIFVGFSCNFFPSPFNSFFFSSVAQSDYRFFYSPII